jgi:hypothetical protein
MAHQTTPHTESEQNRKPDQSDLEPDQLEQSAGRGQDSDLYRNHDGAQTGTNRGPQHAPGSRGNPNTQPAAAAYEGATSTRTPASEKQGITSHSSHEESSRQQKVVKDRSDAKAGVNHSQ